MSYEPSGLVENNVRPMVSQHRMRRLDQEAPQRYLVAHCARENKQTSLFARELGHMSLQVLRRGILVEDVVSEGAS